MLPRWIQIPVALFLGCVTLLSLLGSITMVINPNEMAPVLAPALGILMALACCWLLQKCVFLLIGRRVRGGLFGPLALRLLAWFFLLLPIGGIFTGWFQTHTLVALVQTVAYIATFFALRTLAAVREAGAISPPVD
jgi:hypothetical protein